ncbi:MFS multidrug transporter-like protein [Calycina marina]|uniref:MFS multidrug transporter-like protein n=1 Tax=Calycina marina TaxID=1763456 RepID=A0A9P7ZB67_9HELO|nr:MFS multidrug transporter-like protein [Calycina marina]
MASNTEGDETSERIPDEESPLLNGTPKVQTDPITGEQTVLADEPSTRRLYVVMGSVWIGVFLAALDTTIIATLSAPISTYFDSLSLLSWLASAYLIANAACQPLSGRLTDIFSRRTGLVVSNILFAAGNMLCGLAKSEWSMIGGRVVAGIGGGGIMTIATFVGSDLVPLRKRGLVQGLGNIAFGAGAGLGGLLGGYMDDRFGWRWAFLAQVPPVIASAIIVYFVVDVPAKVSNKSKMSRVDFLGAFTLVLTLVLLLIGLNSGGNIVPWNHPLVWVSLPLSVVSLLAFIYIEARIASEPVIPVKLLLNSTVAAACLTNWFATMLWFMALFYVPIFYQIAGYSNTAAGTRLIPASVGASIGSLGSGLIMNHTGKYKLLCMLLVTIMVAGAGLLATLTFNTPDWPAFIYLLMAGIGYGGMLTVTLLATISAVSHDHQAVVTSATYAFRSTGSTIGVTIAGAVFQNILITSLHSNFDGRPGADAEIERIRNSFDELNHLPKGWRQGVMDSYSGALRGVFLAGLGIGVLSIVSAAFMRQHTLHKSIARRDE